MSISIDKSVFQLVVDHTNPNWESPWIKNDRFKSSGSGFVVQIGGKKYIVTNTHVVLNGDLIRARRSVGQKGFVLKIVYLLYECDLALLEPVGAENLKDIEPLRFKTLPMKRERVHVVGYPLGGHNLSITAGTINRFSMIPYMNAVSGIAIQIDAPINFGNSGGPVIDNDNNVVGVAFAAEELSLADNMGYIIPTVLVNFMASRFLGDRDTNNGLCMLPLDTQFANNASLRKIFKIPIKQEGVLVTNTQIPRVKRFDVLHSINGIAISNEGTVPVSDIIEQGMQKLNIDAIMVTGLKTKDVLPYENLISLYIGGESVKLGLIRDGKPLEVNWVVKPRTFNVPRFEYQDKPRYWSIMGMVFVPLTYMLIKQLRLVGKYTAGLEEYARIPTNGEYVVLTDLVTTEFTEGFPNDNFILHAVNGIKIKSLQHLEDTVADILKKPGHMVFTFKDTPQIAALDIRDIKLYNKKINVSYQ